MRDITFGTIRIGAGTPCVIIAEIGVDHMGDMAKAKRMIDAAKSSGADVAKFQIHLPQIEMACGHEKLAFHGGSLEDVFRRSHMSAAQHRTLMEYCVQHGIQYLCTPFCPASVDVLNDEIGVDAFKTGSGELTNLAQHRKLAKIAYRAGKPVLVSTGMCTIEEIADTVSVYREEGALGRLVLMVCTSEYPLEKYDDISLGLIPRLRDLFGVWVGYSDHSKDDRIAAAAVALGARVIEKHFTLAYGEGGCDDSVALTPELFAKTVVGIRRVESALGSEKRVRPEEMKTREWAFHSVVTNRSLEAGEEITLENVRPARPGTGVPAKFLDEKYSSALLGRMVHRALPKDHVLQWNDLY